MKILLPLLFLFATSITYAQEKTSPKPVEPKDASFAKFDKTVHNFGTIKYGDETICSFTFTNTSEKSLVIKNVQRSCGCTTPSYSTDPVLPGKTGTVKAKYDSTREGSFDKTITIHFTDGSARRLKIKGKVQAQADGE